uniref:Selenoprotein F n=1 Tax=Nothoprocta perdicaria TaxID=30464 RepID=A0A8C6YMS4_NOTPE
MEGGVVARLSAAMAAARAGAAWPWLWLAALQAVTVYGSQLSSEACRELGFSSNLLCSSCNLLGQFSLNELDPFCRQCCQEEAQLESRKVSLGPLWNILIYNVKFMGFGFYV